MNSRPSGRTAHRPARVGSKLFRVAAPVVRRIVDGGRLAVAIGMEGGFMIGPDLTLLERYAELGGAYLGLTHDGHNAIADAEARTLPPERRAAFERRYAEMLERWPLATVADMVDHIDHVVELVGVDHVGIGSDFDGGAGLTGWAHAGETANVTAELLRRGYTEDEIRKIWGGNLLRVWTEVRRFAARDVSHAEPSDDRI